MAAPFLQPEYGYKFAHGVLASICWNHAKSKVESGSFIEFMMIVPWLLSVVGMLPSATASLTTSARTVMAGRVRLARLATPTA